ncbi:MAG TPA: methyltransferase domain-containing protein, partial [Polyangiaceae bacterium LLY-WYZ-15_(1-7)]|nr:methyltransferase domain-containing protein [Polyangiaceae bacterium LLY-WYZ-15_(1-7)]
RRAGLLDAPFVLDVGAGSGAPARFLRDAGVETLCVDVDRSILRHAPRPALVARADRLPLPALSVPAVHTRLMLQHVPDPAAVLAELHRVTAPGGALLAVDTDHASFVSEPAPRRCEAARQTWIARTLERGADPFVGRRLRALALGAGWSEVKVEAATLTSDDIGPEAFAELLLLPYLHATTTDPEALAAGRAEAGEWAAAPGSFAMATLLLLSARRRPEGSAS